MYIVFTPSDYANPLMSLLNQIADNLVGRCFIIYQYGRYPGILCICIRHHRRSLIIRGKTTDSSRMSRYVNHTVNHVGIQFLQHGIQNRMISSFIIVPGILPPCIHTQIPDCCPVSPLLTAAHDTLNNLRSCKLRNIFCDNANGFRFLAAQALSNGIRTISAFLNYLQNSLLCLLSHLCLAIQDI